MKTKIVIVDENPICRYGLRHLLQSDKDIVICGETDNAMEAVDMIGKYDPDIVLADITIKYAKGVEFIKQIKSINSKTSVFVLSNIDEKLYGERIYKAGARGFLGKTAAPETIRNAIRKVINGHIYINDDIAEILLEKKFTKENKHTNGASINRLSDRELIIFELIAQGYKPKQIAEQLSLSSKTVENYRVNIREKLRLESAAHLLQYAIEWSKFERHAI